MTKSKKVQKVAKTVEESTVVSTEDKRKALLAKALGKDIKDVHLIPDGKDEAVEALYQQSLLNAKNKPAPIHDPLPINEDIKEETTEEELEIVEVPPVKGKKVIPQNTKQAEKLIAKAEAEKKVAEKPSKTANQLLKEQEEQEVQVEEKEVVSPVRTRTNAPVKGRVIPEEMTGKELKQVIKAEKKNNKPATTGAKPKFTTPLSKMTIEELEEIKGTISDVQWKKYYKMAGGVAKKESKPVIIVEKKVKALPVETKVKVPEIKRNKPAVKAAVSKLADVPLDELFAELQRRGCKGSITICSEFEL